MDISAFGTANIDTLANQLTIAVTHKSQAGMPAVDISVTDGHGHRVAVQSAVGETKKQAELLAVHWLENSFQLFGKRYEVQGYESAITPQGTDFVLYAYDKCLPAGAVMMDEDE